MPNRLSQKEKTVKKEKDSEDLGGDGAGGDEEGVLVAMLEPQPHHRLRQHLHQCVCVCECECVCVRVCVCLCVSVNVSV